MSSPSSPTVEFRRIRTEDDASVARIIRTVMTEHGAVGPGFSIEDPEVDGMSAAYAADQSAYFVAEHAGTVLGGAGIAPLAGAEPDVCELRKMYLLPEARGQGVGRLLLDACIGFATIAGYRSCYLETLASMAAAERLYVAAGFERIDRQLGATGHFGCNRYYLRQLA